MYATYLAMALTWIVAHSYAGDALPPGVFLALVCGSLVAWWLGTVAAWRLIRRQTRRAPASGLPSDWAFDEGGVTIVNPLSTTRLDWRAVRDVREEKDRFVFLVLPMNNPVLPRRLLDVAQLETLRNLTASVKSSGRLGAGVD